MPSKAKSNTIAIKPTYKIIGNNRYVKPYIFEFSTFAKGRWLGRRVIDVLLAEFGGYDLNYWEHAIANSNILVNNARTHQDYVFRNSDRLVHRTHRHEPPIQGGLQFVGETDELFAVCKPSSWPMHPCGGYRFNTLTAILSHEPLVNDQPELSTVHRLDRVTSGLIVLAKSARIAGEVSKEIRENSTQKVYLARVRGRFPTMVPDLPELTVEQLRAPTESEEVQRELGAACTVSQREEYTDTQTSVKKKKPNPETQEVEYTGRVASPASVPEGTEAVGWGMDGDLLLVRCPITVANYREGIHACDRTGSTGKLALSAFRNCGYCAEDDTSLVECYPHTGRTHQLRLHLQLIGTPIANDPCYGGELFYGDSERLQLARGVARRLLKQKQASGGRLLHHLPHLHHLCDEDSGGVSEDTAEDAQAESRIETSIAPVVERIDTESDEEYLVRSCRYCQPGAGVISPEDEALVHCDGIWLHALRYSGKNWSFETQEPEWANREKFL